MLVRFILLTIPMIAAGILICGAVAADMWNWFVVSLLGLPTVSVAQAAGLVLFRAMLVSGHNEDDDDDDDDSFGAQVVSLALVGSYWCMGSSVSLTR